MKIEFNDEEIEALPEEVRTKIKDNKFEGTPGDFIPDVTGLKSALEKNRDEKKLHERTIKTIAEKFGAKTSDVLTAVDSFISKNGNKDAALHQVADADMRTIIAEFRGNVTTLPANVRERVQWSEELAKYVVPGEDGEPLVKEDGTLKGVRDVVAEMQADAKFGNNFARTNDNSGGGSDPQKGNDGRSGRVEDDSKNSEAPPKSMSKKDMTSRQRMLAAQEPGGLEMYPS